MSRKDIILGLWRDIDGQSWDKLASYFSEDAVINWRNTNECFNVAEFVTANSAYPGDWRVETERLAEDGDTVISAVRVYSEAEGLTFHAVSFFKFDGDKVVLLDEYWGTVEKAPQWRLDMGLGKAVAPEPSRRENQMS